MAVAEEQLRWIQEAREGNERSFDRLVEPMRSKLLNYLVSRLRSRDDAEDLLQQALIAAYQHLGSFRGDCPFENWLWLIATNLCKRYYKQQAAQSRKEVSLDAEWEFFSETAQHTETETTLLELEDKLWVEQVLEAARSACAPNELRVLLLYYRGASFDEIARWMSANSATVRSYFLRGRANLLAHLIRYCPDLAGGKDVIDRVTEQLHLETGADAFSAKEKEALSRPDRYPKAFRSACLKIAKRLPSPI
ncbi:MAG: RNA polymerase sigma factor [Fimbriimonadia bacterium]|nr:RNA polymerase sigma factor [Fimbriimonadia bacterium]